jgi:hypothetical protein
MRPRREVARQSVGVRLDQTILAAAEKAADAEHRTLSNLMELALLQYLQRKGYMPLPTTLSSTSTLRSTKPKR